MAGMLRRVRRILLGGELPENYGDKGNAPTVEMYNILERMFVDLAQENKRLHAKLASYEKE